MLVSILQRWARNFHTFTMLYRAGQVLLGKQCSSLWLDDDLHRSFGNMVEVTGLAMLHRQHAIMPSFGAFRRQSRSRVGPQGWFIKTNEEDSGTHRARPGEHLRELRDERVKCR